MRTMPLKAIPILLPLAALVACGGQMEATKGSPVATSTTSAILADAAGVAVSVLATAPADAAVPTAVAPPAGQRRAGAGVTRK